MLKLPKDYWTLQYVIRQFEKIEKDIKKNWKTIIKEIYRDHYFQEIQLFFQILFNFKLHTLSVDLIKDIKKSKLNFRLNIPMNSLCEHIKKNSYIED